MRQTCNHSRRWFASAAAVALIMLAGCGNGRHPVYGKVVYDDGSPVTEGNVIGYSGEGAAMVMVQGPVKPDGTFTWGSDKPGEGAPPGKYRIAVTARALGDAERAAGKLPAVDGKYANPDKSGIEFEVKPGKNELTVTVSRPKPGKGG